MSRQEKFEKLVWSENYSSGLIYLDNHRRNFLDILNELIEVVNEKSCATHLPMVFQRMAFYAEDYFTKKEMALKDCQDLPVNTYRAEHDRFTKAIALFHDEFRHGSTSVCKELLEFLLEWFHNYVKTFGTEAADYLRKKGYE